MKKNKYILFIATLLLSTNLFATKTNTQENIVEQKTFTCLFCKKQHPKKEQTIKHILKKHITTKDKLKKQQPVIILCCPCGKKFEYYHLHARRGYFFYDNGILKTKLTEHLEAEHIKEQVDTSFYECDLCNKKFSTEKKCRKHVKNKHIDISNESFLEFLECREMAGGTTEYICDCGESFDDTMGVIDEGRSLKIHTKHHTKKTLNTKDHLLEKHIEILEQPKK